jgi:hypothetical protein
MNISVRNAVQIFRNVFPILNQISSPNVHNAAVKKPVRSFHYSVHQALPVGAETVVQVVREVPAARVEGIDIQSLMGIPFLSFNMIPVENRQYGESHCSLWTFSIRKNNLSSRFGGILPDAWT